VRLLHLQAVRYERVLPEGRTHPLLLGCRPPEPGAASVPRVVKALGCPEVTAHRQLVAEVIGNAFARRMGILTPEPCIVRLDEAVARAVEASLRSEGYLFAPRSGFAAGCEYLKLAPYAPGQYLNPEQRTQAARLYVFDMLSQNSDRRPAKVNCALGAAGLVAFDFESCFQHLFVPIIGGLLGPHWEPSKSLPGREHLFHATAKAHPHPEGEVESSVQALTIEWWRDLVSTLPDEWQPEASKIGAVLREIVGHAGAFARDITLSLA
jgi:hypothetical protein